MEHEQTIGEQIKERAERLADLALEELRRRGVSEAEIEKIRAGMKRPPKSRN